MVTDRIPRIAVAAGAVFSVSILAFVAYTRPGYFTPQYLQGLLLIEILLAALWMYRRAFLPILILAFLAAGTGLPLGGSMWTAGRWFVLGIGAVAGSLIVLKERGQHFFLFHALAILTVLTALISAAVSRYPGISFLKAGSLLVLFLYAGTGARLAASGRQQRFTAGLLAGCEIFLGAVILFYLAGQEFMGNPNSLGAVMGVAIAPVLLWGALVAESRFVYHRRLLGFAAAMYFVFHSMARAGLLAAILSCAILCLALRRYRLIAKGLLSLVILSMSTAVLSPEAFSQKLSSLTNMVLYKDKDPSAGVLGSRKTPWQASTDSIQKHFWFGSGFGTTDTGFDASEHLDTYATTLGTTTENGSSYLAILSWVGILGVIPFAALLLSLIEKLVRSFLWLLNTSNHNHPAIPLALIITAGLIHAGFEDWLFAPGYYLCVFFWTVAFVFVDLAPWAPLPSFRDN